MAIVTADTREGRVFEGRPKIVSWERLWAFSGGPFSSAGWPKKNIHTDPEFARGCGLPHVAASATQFQGYVVEIMVYLFGLGWLRHGTMDVKFINIVDAGDTLVPTVTIKAKEALDGGTRFIMDVSCENQNGSKVLVGAATGMVGTVNLPRNRPDTAGYENKRLSEVLERASLEPLEFTVTPELNQQYLYAVEDFQPWYIEETESGPPVVHPALLLNMSNGTRSPSYSQPAGRAGFHARDETFFYNTARLGKKLRVTWNPIGSYDKRDRPYTVNDTLIVDEDGLEILRRLNHSTVASQEHTKDYRK
jgi:hypothetical protein